MSPCRHVPMRRPQGFSLVEMLVALVILSVGMLGMAGLYVESLRAGRSALTRSEAVILVTDMADRIRANPDAKLNYNKLIDDTGTITAACNPPLGLGCTKEQMAANDIAQWGQMVDDRYDDPSTGRVGLPSGRGTVTVVVGPVFTSYTISVSWVEVGQRNDAGGTERSSYTMEFEQ